MAEWERDYAEDLKKLILSADKLTSILYSSLLLLLGTTKLIFLIPNLLCASIVSERTSTHSSECPSVIFVQELCSSENVYLYAGGIQQPGMPDKKIYALEITKAWKDYLLH